MSATPHNPGMEQREMSSAQYLLALAPPKRPNNKAVSSNNILQPPATSLPSQQAAMAVGPQRGSSNTSASPLLSGLHRSNIESRATPNMATSHPPSTWISSLRRDVVALANASSRASETLRKLPEKLESPSTSEVSSPHLSMNHQFSYEYGPTSGLTPLSATKRFPQRIQRSSLLTEGLGKLRATAPSFSYDPPTAASSSPYLMHTGTALHGNDRSYGNEALNHAPYGVAEPKDEYSFTNVGDASAEARGYESAQQDQFINFSSPSPDAFLDPNFSSTPFYASLASNQGPMVNQPRTTTFEGNHREERLLQYKEPQDLDAEKYLVLPTEFLICGDCRTATFNTRIGWEMHREFHLAFNKKVPGQKPWGDFAQYFTGRSRFLLSQSEKQSLKRQRCSVIFTLPVELHGDRDSKVATILQSIRVGKVYHIFVKGQQVEVTFFNNVQASDLIRLAMSKEFEIGGEPITKICWSDNPFYQEQIQQYKSRVIDIKGAEFGERSAPRILQEFGILRRYLLSVAHVWSLKRNCFILRLTFSSGFKGSFPACRLLKAKTSLDIEYGPDPCDPDAVERAEDSIVHTVKYYFKSGAASATNASSEIPGSDPQPPRSNAQISKATRQRDKRRAQREAQNMAEVNLVGEHDSVASSSEPNSLASSSAPVVKRETKETVRVPEDLDTVVDSHEMDQINVFPAATENDDNTPKLASVIEQHSVALSANEPLTGPSLTRAQNDSQNTQELVSAVEQLSVTLPVNEPQAIPSPPMAQNDDENTQEQASDEEQHSATSSVTEPHPMTSPGTPTIPSIPQRNLSTKPKYGGVRRGRADRKRRSKDHKPERRARGKLARLDELLASSSIPFSLGDMIGDGSVATLSKNQQRKEARRLARERSEISEDSILS